MMRARCSLTSFCNRANSARVGPAPSCSWAPAAPATGATARDRDRARGKKARPRQWELRLIMTIPLAGMGGACTSVDEQQGRREDVVLDLGDAAVLAVVEVLGLEHDAVAE